MAQIAAKGDSDRLDSPTAYLYPLAMVEVLTPLLRLQIHLL